ncbi:hypothetical protein [Phycicoccus duodecadis]|uniref:Uncharacterized protein n=1 Tax=Phycicoccus duodecadis TaxID=173053 RepID=A0A2N3YFT7_9MICO|nr:hypothetical protein [Phycicoccus duodecadis]PKW25722.1 hypothetical protein ATL31_0521 [Phycicoccus duodecadis]
MFHQSNDQDLVQVLITPRSSDGFPSSDEPVWATPEKAGEGGGTYRLVHPALDVPLTLDDVVTCRLDGHGRLRVVGVETPARRMHTGVVVAPGTDPDDVTSLAAGWSERWGSLSWIVGDLVLTAWPTDMDVDAVDAVLVTDVDSRDGWEVIGLAEPHERTTGALRGLVDFELDVTAPPGHEDGYWAAEDPEWARLGVTSPDVIAAIQSLAASHPRVVPAIRAGLHRDVLTLLRRLSTRDATTLAPLSGPLFTPTGS